MGPIPFAVGDVDTPNEALALERASSSATLVPETSIAFGGSRENRTMTITPTLGMAGTAVITITVSDGEYVDHDAFELRIVEHSIYMALVFKNR